MAVASDLSLAPVARAAAAGDHLAWEHLVRRFEPVLRGVVRRFRLNAADVDDVVQNTWLLAYAHLANLDDPAAIGRWMVVVARREALRTLQRGVHEVTTEDPLPPAVADPSTPETIALRHERLTALVAAVGRLSGRQRDLMDALLRDADRSYQELSLDLEMPIGSIGPTRDRALERLRDDAALVDVCRDSKYVA
jgi:RNA polymerase sigma factor (sigma-70 family)